MTNKTIEIHDPNILLSIINMKLRDYYESLDLLCNDLELEKEEILKKLEDIGYYYNEQENQFK